MKSIKSIIVVTVALGILFLIADSSIINNKAMAVQLGQQREVIKETGTHPAGLPFSPAIKIGNMMFVSGTIGMDPKSQEVISDDIEKQTRQTMENLRAILQKGGMDFSDVVSGTVYLTDLMDYDEMNKVYSSYFPKDPPARACVEVTKLVKGAKVEISMIAVKTE